jgi:hypothetical protein
MKGSGMAIQQFSINRCIPSLVHFTRASNLPSILANGLYPISQAHELAVAPMINDSNRFDGHLDASSLSIAFPNNLMFFKYRKDDENVDWVVLQLHPQILWTMPCAFCRYNAADARISRQPRQALAGLWALESMFDEDPEQKPRAEQNLRLYDTTDVQAEVMVFDRIGPEKIFSVGFQTNASRNTYSHLLGWRKSHVWGKTGGLFASRGYARYKG